MNKALKIILIVFLSLILLVAAFFVVVTVTEYKPDSVETLNVDGSSQKQLTEGDTLDIVSWNIGFACLDDSSDFFMDGGSQVNPATEEETYENLSSISDRLNELDPDITFIQEIDLNSNRSHSINEVENLLGSLDVSDSIETVFAYNFKSLFVPYPIPPIGHVESGLLTVSGYDTQSAERIALPCPFSWPVSTCNLKRCLLVTRMPVSGSNKELVLINLHLEAYDDGEGKAAQTRQLIELLNEEYEKGNYVIAGGDFNQVFSNIDTTAYTLPEDAIWKPGVIDTSSCQDHFSWLMDNSCPSCRSLDKVYEGADKENFQYYLIDGFIVSDNLTVNSMETLNYDFENSDHNPIELSVTLK